MSCKHKTLTLQEKIKVIEEHEINKRPAKELIVLFKVGKTQIYDILKNKVKIKEEWGKGTAGHVRRVTKPTDYDQINRAMFEWFCSARAKGLAVSGPLLQSVALETARKLGKHQFKASNGWLESFKHRHNIAFNGACEVNDADVKTEDMCTAAISDLCKEEDLSDDAENVHLEDSMEEVDERDKIRTFGEALSVVRELQKFAASKDLPQLLELMHDANKIIQRSVGKKS